MTEKELNDISRKLLETGEAYYNTGHPVMSDQEYDSLAERLKAECPDHPFFLKVGEKASSLWEKSSHRIPMGSLEKVHTQEDFIKWAEKFGAETFVIQPKFDGLSLSQDYERDGANPLRFVFVRAITRGDGIEGEDISGNVRLMKGFKSEIYPPWPVLPDISYNTGAANNWEAFPDSFSVRCEILLPKNDLDRINSTLGTDDRYKNCRNAASGISRRLDGKFCQYLKLAYYDITVDIDENDKILFFSQTVSKENCFCVGGNIQNMIEVFNKFREKRGEEDVNMDGMVVKLDSWRKQKEAGFNSNNRPKGQIAWKFEPPSEATVLRGVTWEVGRTGVITPLGHVEPVCIDGSTIQNVTLHNIAEIRRLGIGLGDLVTLVKAGEIIPKIVSVIEHKNTPIKIPEKCPACGSALENNDVQLFCNNDDCKAKNFQRIMNFIKAVKIDDFGEALAGILFESGKLKTIADIFILKKEDIAELEGWGGKSADTIISNIAGKRNIEPALLLAALGIPTLSVKTAEDLIGKFETIHRVRAATVEEISSIKGYSTVSATGIVEGLKKFDGQMQEVLKRVCVKTAAQGGKLAGKSFCFTGEMSRPRTFFQELVSKNGGKNDSGVTRTTTYLVCNEGRGSSKSRKAEQYGTRIINEQEFKELVGFEEKPVPRPGSLFTE